MLLSYCNANFLLQNFIVKNEILKPQQDSGISSKIVIGIQRNFDNTEECYTFCK